MKAALLLAALVPGAFALPPHVIDRWNKEHRAQALESSLERWADIHKDLNNLENSLELVLHDDGHMTHVLSEKKVPRGQGRTLIKRSIHMDDMERWPKWFDDFVEAVVQPVAQVFIEVIVEPIVAVVEVVVEIAAPIFAAAVDTFRSVVDAIKDALSWVTNAMFEAAIGCNPVSHVAAVLSEAGGELISEMKDYIDTKILNNLDEMMSSTSLEREERRKANEEWTAEVTAYRTELDSLFKSSYTTKAEQLKTAYKACMSAAGATFDADGHHTCESATQCKAERKCRKMFHDSFEGVKREFRTDPNVEAKTEALKKSPKMPKKANAALERKYGPDGITGELEKDEAQALLDIMPAEVRTKMRELMTYAVAECDGLFDGNELSLERGELSLERGLSLERDSYVPAVCVSLGLGASAGGNFVSGGIGGELGLCEGMLWNGRIERCLKLLILYSSYQRPRPRIRSGNDGDLFGFYGFGGGLSIGVGQSGGSISGDISITIFRNKGAACPARHTPSRAASGPLSVPFDATSQATLLATQLCSAFPPWNTASGRSFRLLGRKMRLQCQASATSSKTCGSSSRRLPSAASS